jgi:hypothetical protein
MTRSTALLLGLAALVGVAVYLFAAEEPPAAAPVPVSVTPETPHALPVAVSTSTTPATTAPPPVRNWAADVAASDAATRAAAINALATASREQALPILKIVLTSGEPVIDKPLALRALRELARRDGDADGAIRELVRQSVYHADTEEFSRAAQDALDDLEKISSR